MVDKKHERKKILEAIIKKDILEAVVKILTHDGIQGLTMERVASEAGVAKGTLYLYFKDKQAILEATRTRLRPIYMSTFTSIFGMLPLVVAPGPGSEIYRGIGSVLLGGLAISSIFVIFIIPSLLMFVIKMEETKNVD